MASVEMNTSAPDFSLIDFNGKTVKLSDYQKKNNVLLVMNRGFV